MRAAAILGPNTHPRDLRQFQARGMELVVVADLPLEGGFDAALVFGGDGSVHRQLHAAVTSQVPVLCVPMGSGNDFARALGLRSRGDALGAWHAFCRTGNGVRAIDVVEIVPLDSRNSPLGNGTCLYCCVAGVGLDSEVNRRANRLPSWLRGHGGYALSLAPALLGFLPPRITVELFDSNGPSRVDDSAMLVAFANAPSYGHGMCIAPRARLDDAKLDLCFVRRTSKLRLLRLFPTVFSGEHLDLPEVVYAQCSGLRIETDPPLDIFGDGEFIARTPAELRMRTGALRVIAQHAADTQH